MDTPDNITIFNLPSFIPFLVNHEDISSTLNELYDHQSTFLLVTSLITLIFMLGKITFKSVSFSVFRYHNIGGSCN